MGAVQKMQQELKKYMMVWNNQNFYKGFLMKSFP